MSESVRYEFRFGNRERRARPAGQADRRSRSCTRRTLGAGVRLCQAIAASLACVARVAGSATGRGGLFWYVALCSGAGLAVGSTHDFEPVADGIYLRPGLHEPIDAAHIGQLANTGFIVGESAVAVIDPGGTPAAARELRAAVERVTDRPIRYVILTHLHPDHMLGAIEFRDVKTVLAHERYADLLPSQGLFFLNRFLPELAARSGLDALLQPTQLIAGTESIDLGNRVLQITAHPVGHSTTDLTVFDTATDTLWASDLLFRDRTPSLDGNLRGWLAALQELSGSSYARVIPGHGEPGSWDEVAGEQQRYLQDLQADTQAALARGASLSEVIRTAEQADPGHWKQFSLHHPINASKAYTELEWD